LASALQRAAESHWHALAQLAVARSAADAGLGAPPAHLSQAGAATAPGPPSGPGIIEIRVLIDQLVAAARGLAPGWLGEDLATALDEPLGVVSTLDDPVAVRVGEARVRDAGAFPALVPLLGGGHLVIDADARDASVAGLLRCLVLRLAAAVPAGSLRVLATDQAALGGTFLPLRGLIEAGVLAPPATSADEVRRVLDETGAHVQRSLAGRGDGSWLLLVVASAPEGRAELDRLAALTHAGPAARVCLIAAGWPKPGRDESTGWSQRGHGESTGWSDPGHGEPTGRSERGGEPSPALGTATRLWMRGPWARVGDPPGKSFGAEGRGLAAPVAVDTAVPAPVVAKVAAALGERLRRESTLRFVDLIPPELWTGTSTDGLRTTIGRTGRAPMELAFDDATPHWLVGGRTGAGKTVFLLDVLYGLAARYPPDELALYLLDFKEGISFTEFTPTARDPSFIPHARAVGIESDREYGVAVLRELSREMNRRAAILKRNAATSLAQLRHGGDVDSAMPRIVTVIDEFQVLFERNDRLAGEATALLEELARKGRSYGIHLVLASQTVSGVEALYGKGDSIFGQFPLRVALPGGSGVLDVLNTAAEGLTLGGAVVNDSAGLAGAERTVRFPDAHAERDAVTEIRHRMWEQRTPGAAPPAVFAGYATQQVEDDPTFRGLAPGGRRPLALVGRVLDVPQSTGSFALDATPGRHLAIVGTSVLGADVLHAATVSIGRQHAPDAARFLVAPLVAAADEVADETMAALRAAGHTVSVLDAHGLRDELRKLAGPAGSAHGRTYLVVFGVDAAGGTLAARDPETFSSGQDDLRAVLRGGPAAGVHLLGWWRGLRRMTDDIGGSGNREDISCLVALNVPGQELGMYLGQLDLAYHPRANRALLVDRDEQRISLLVPFVRPGRVVEEV
jgi:hypothetical protein